MSQKDHWEQIYSSEPTESLGWYKSHLETSLNWINETGLAVDAPIIDIGGGASTLVDDLLYAGYRSITVLDLSEKALSAVKTRLGKRSGLVTWLSGDITSVDLPPNHYELWHDRAVFHFLIAAADREAYLEKMKHALKPGAHIIIATFAEDGPTKCSGLPVQRYSLESLLQQLGPSFKLQNYLKQTHITPSDKQQSFIYCHCLYTG